MNARLRTALGQRRHDAAHAIYEAARRGDEEAVRLCAQTIAACDAATGEGDGRNAEEIEAAAWDLARYIREWRDAA